MCTYVTDAHNIGYYEKLKSIFGLVTLKEFPLAKWVLFFHLINLCRFRNSYFCVCAEWYSVKRLKDVDLSVWKEEIICVLLARTSVTRTAIISRHSGQHLPSRMSSIEILWRVAPERTNVSHERIASITRLTGIGELGTLAVTSNRSTIIL
jgi:hypothetical protein